jgi:16S rRNA (cytosine1402-N4)-methyltransferase
MRISAAPHRQPAGVSAQAAVVREIQIAQASSIRASPPTGAANTGKTASVRCDPHRPGGNVSLSLTVVNSRQRRVPEMIARTHPPPPAHAGAPPHVPVLLRQAIDYVAPHDGGIYIDGTFGAGGHAIAILRAADTRVIGIDRDADAVAAGAPKVEASGGRLMLVEGRFGALDTIASGLGVAATDGVLLDLGVSSMQLGTPGRGFSFRHDGPLDMRMGRDGPSAADIVAVASERDLADIIFSLGEERHARGVARAIVAARQQRPIVSTRALAEIVASVVHERGDIHPATRTFQALRLFVNDELHELEDGLAAAERVLKPGSRLVVISFHSLEDRIVKIFLAMRSRPSGGSRHVPEKRPEAATFRVLTRRPVTPDAAEIGENPRARSAKLRAAERTDAPARIAAGVPISSPPPPMQAGRTEGAGTMARGLPSLTAVLRGNRR